ncbi:MAG: autotransporter assembly complex family protein [Pseudomonadota bacterium]
MLTSVSRCIRFLLLAALVVTGVSVANARVVYPDLDERVQANVSAYLTLERLGCDVSAADIDRGLAAAPDQIAEALQALGYYTPTINFRREQAEDCWAVYVDLNPGPRVTYSDIEISVVGGAADDPVVRARLDALALRSGVALDHGVYAEAKRGLNRLLASRGFLEADFETSKLEVSLDSQQADVIWDVVSGPRYRIGEISIQQEAFDDALVRRFVTLKSGDFFDRSALQRQQKALQSSALIAAASVTADTESTRGKTVPIKIVIEPVERIGYFTGIGVSTDRGPRVRAGYRNRRVNDKGHQVDVDLRASPVLSEASARYRRPLMNPLVEWESYQWSASAERTDTSESDIAQVGWERIRVLDNGWIATYGLQASQTEFVVAGSEDSTTLLMPVAGFSRRQADSDTNPRSGYATDFNFRTASESAFSTTSFFQAYVRQTYLRPVGDNGRLKFRGELGYTWRDDFDALPPEIRFFAGGDNSVRGYDFETIGPSDSEGRVIGGSRLAVGSIEYEFDFTATFGVAAFFDVGSAFDGGAPEWQRGTGLGVVWRSPVGPLRAYLGHALDGERGVRLHVNFGSDL